MGGLWEAGIKSIKYHLKRVIGETSLTYEELTTVLHQIEACLNSRPLRPLSNDPEDLEVLTPGHFLIGAAPLSPPTNPNNDDQTNSLTRWRLVNKLQRDFWKIWSSEYLSSLQQRTKWTNKTSNTKTGDIVIIKEDNLPPARWLLGRIIETHPGKDGLVRVATVKTAKNVILRPITKLCKLPFCKDDLQNLPSLDEPAAQTKATDGIVTTTKTSKRKNSDSVKIHPTNIPIRPPIEELRKESMAARSPKRIRTSNILTILILLNCVLSSLSAPLPSRVSGAGTPSLTAPLVIKKFEHNPGMYMEHVADLHMVNNVWNTIVYYDLNTYYMQLNGFKQCVDKLTELCNKTITYRYYCSSIVLELKHKVEEMHQNNIILHKRNGNHMIKNKQKRAPLEIIGTLQNSLFGILDQNYAHYIEEEIGKLRENENYLLSLAKNQTSITEVTTNVLKKTTNEIQHQFEVFNNHVTSSLEVLKSGIDKNELIQTFTAMTTYTSLIMNNYEKVQRELIEVVLDAHNGKISPFILTPFQLKEQLRHIREHISTSLVIPGETSSEDMLNLYKIMTVKSRILDKMIIFKIHIPLPDMKLFQLFKLYPIPTKYNNEYFYIQPSSEFLAASLHRDLYYPLSQAELTECTKTQVLGYLCQQKHPVYTTQAPVSRCEMDLLNHKQPPVSACSIKKTHPSQYWIQLEHQNQWIFVTNERTTINLVCGNQVIIRDLEESGIIELNQSCQVKHPTMSISSKTTFSDSQKSSFLPITNLSSMISEAQLRKSTDTQPIPLVHLDTKPLDNLNFYPVKETFPTINYHHVHHYFLIYAVIIVIAAAAIWYKLQSKCRSSDSTNNYRVQPVTPRPPPRTTSTSA